MIFFLFFQHIRLDISCKESQKVVWNFYPNVIQEKRAYSFKYLLTFLKYIIQPNYRTYSCKCAVKQFCSLQNTASVLFVYFFIKAYVVDTHLNCIAFINKIRKNNRKHKRGRQHSFNGDWSWNIFYTHSLPSTDSRTPVVSFWRKNVHTTS